MKNPYNISINYQNNGCISYKLEQTFSTTFRTTGKGYTFCIVREYKTGPSRLDMISSIVLTLEKVALPFV